MTALTESPRTDEPTADTPARHDRRYAVALTVLLLGTGALYLWDLAASGWANSFYAAAAQAGSQSWTAFLFGSSDAANAITVDKPPASLWVMSLSIRAFGLSSWSLLVPQALMGVASVALLVAAVRRWAGPVAGLLAGLVLALTPVAVLMFRFDNPDALLVLLMTAAAYAVVRATDTDRGRAATGWLVLGGVLLGLGFLTKMLQVGLVVPGLAAAYLLAGSGTLRGRFGRLALAGVAFVVSAGWWVLLVELVPSGSRPYVGGSQTDSVWELIWGYNGLGRLTGDEVGSVGGGGSGGGPGGGGGGGGFGGEAGIGRLFSASFAGQASWLLPTALLLLVAVLGLTWRRPRTDRLRAAAVMWGGWLLVTAAVFSAMSGIIHEYYTVALAPAVAALVGVGAVVLWDRRDRLVARLLAAATVLVTATWSWELLGRSADFLPWLRWVVLAVGVVAAVGLVLVTMVSHRAFLAAVVAGTVLTGLAGPAAYSAQTVATAHTGSIVTAGPQVDDGERGGPGGGGPGGGGPPTGAPPTGAQGEPQGLPQGAPPGGGGGAPGGGAGGPGGLLDAAEPDADVLAALMEEQGRTWLAATIGSQSAAGYQLATEEPVMAIGGFNGSDPAPTLEEFQDLVADGRIGWFVASGVSGRSDGGSEAASEIAAWVEATFTPVEVGSTTLYRLTGS